MALRLETGKDYLNILTADRRLEEIASRLALATSRAPIPKKRINERKPNQSKVSDLFKHSKFATPLTIGNVGS
jgi:hypothetical protein